MKKTIVMFFVFFVFSGCGGRVDNSGDAAAEGPPPEFISVSPKQSDWFEVETGEGLKKYFWGELSNQNVNKFLPLEKTYISILKKDGEIGAGFATAKVSGSAGKYQVVMDYAKYRDAIGSNGRQSRVGVGVRVVANVETKKSNVDLGSIFAIGAAAKAGSLTGDIEVLKIGIDSPKFGSVLPPPTDISDASLQNALLAVGAIRTRVFDSDTILTPHIIAEQYEKQKIELVAK